MTRTARPTVSVIIASHGRPEALSLCLTAVSQLAYYPFEIVVVACVAGCAAVAAHPEAARIVSVPQPEANVALARNLGLANSGGEIAAFLDDDAIPEPFWLDHLVHPLATGLAKLSGGFVTGRNGFDLQWGARSVDRLALHKDIRAPGAEPFVPDLPEGLALRTEGTNMAARRGALAELGGFDTGYRFYLDDTDLNMRAAESGFRTASVPRARVWHRQLPSARRGPDRVPRDLTDIGRSLARYLDRHAPTDAREAALSRHRENERARAIRHMVRGTLSPDDLGPLLRSFDAGFRDRQDIWLPWEGRGADAFRAFRSDPAPDHSGMVVRIGPGFGSNRISFEQPGYWLRSGGRLGVRHRAATPEFNQELPGAFGNRKKPGTNSRNFSPFDENA